MLNQGKVYCISFSIQLLSGKSGFFVSSHVGKNAHLNTENFNTFIYIMTSDIRYKKIIHTGCFYASCFTPLLKKETIQFLC